MLEINENKINALKNDVRQLENESSQFMSPEPPKEKKGRGRPKMSEAEKQAKKQAQFSGATGAQKPQGEPSKAGSSDAVGSIPTAMITIPIAKGISAMGVQFAGHPAAAMQANEEEAIAMALGLVLDKYMPDVGSKYGPEMVLALTLSQYGLRLVAIKKAIKLQTEQQHARAKQTESQTAPEAKAHENKFSEISNVFTQEDITDEQKEKSQTLEAQYI